MGNLRRKKGDKVKGGKWIIRIKYDTNGKEIKVPLRNRKAGMQEEYVQGREGAGQNGKFRRASKGKIYAQKEPLSAKAQCEHNVI